MKYDNLLSALVNNGSAKVLGPEDKWMLYFSDLALIFKPSIDNQIQIFIKKNNNLESLIQLKISEIPSFIPSFLKKLEIEENSVYSKINDEKLEEVESFKNILEEKILSLSLKEFEVLPQAMPRNMRILNIEEKNHFISFEKNNESDSAFSYIKIETVFISSNNSPIIYYYYYSIYEKDNFKLLNEIFNSSSKKNLFDLLSEKTQDSKLKSIIINSKLSEVLDSQEKPVRMKKV